MRADSSKRESDYVAEDSYSVSHSSCNPFFPISKILCATLVVFLAECFRSHSSTTRKSEFNKLYVFPSCSHSLATIRFRPKNQALILPFVDFSDDRNQHISPTSSPESHLHHALFLQQIHTIQPTQLYHLSLYSSPYAVQRVQKTHPFATLPVKKKDSRTSQERTMLKKRLQALHKLLRG